jgi:soluble lytic murein transglycosylase-like protein
LSLSVVFIALQACKTATQQSPQTNTPPPVAAQAYQESTIDQTKTSAAGAVGVMQIKPSTAADKTVNIQGVDKDIQTYGSIMSS